jgi:hypothetical protein
MQQAEKKISRRRWDGEAFVRSVIGNGVAAITAYAKGRQKADEIHWQREHPAGGVHQGAEGVRHKFQALQEGITVIYAEALNNCSIFRNLSFTESPPGKIYDWNWSQPGPGM